MTLRFDLMVNEETVTRVSVINTGRAAGGCVYEWNAWRQHRGAVQRYAAGELVHDPDLGIEELAIRVLQEYRSVWQE